MSCVYLTIRGQIDFIAEKEKMNEKGNLIIKKNSLCELMNHMQGIM
jgi:hypothetical protein